MQKNIRRVWVRSSGATRVFLALPVSDDWSISLVRFQKQAQSNNYTGNIPTLWTPLGNLHITIRFIGMLPKRHISGLLSVICKLSTRIKPFDLPFDRITTATKDDPKMIWVQFEKTESFQQLTEQAKNAITWYLSTTCKGMKLLDGHQIIPHITLARLKGKMPEAKYIPFSDHPAHFAVSSLVLYASQTGSKGSVYRILGTFPLTGGG